MNFKYGKNKIVIFVGIILLALFFKPAKSQAAEQVMGGETQETAIEISLDKDYEAVISLGHDETTGIYFGETWYKVKVPKYAHYIGLATEELENGMGTLYSICNEDYDLKDIYYDSYESVVSSYDNYRIRYYYLDGGESYCYIHAWSYSEISSPFRVIAGIHPLQEENAIFQLNQEYKEKFDFYSNSNSEICTSSYSFVAPYTGKYRVICDSRNGNANCEILSGTGQLVKNIYCERNQNTSNIIELIAGIKYSVNLFGSEIDDDKPAIASFYISSASIEAINLEKTEITLKKSEQYTISPQIEPEIVVDPSVTYRTSNKKVATVSKNGCITAVGGGKATITVDSNDGSGVQAKIQVTVKAQKVTRLDLNVSKLVLKKNTGVTPTLKAKTYPTNADDGSVTFKSSNSKIVAVDAKTGKLYPKKAGTVTITCVTNDGSKLKKKCKVIVKKSYFR